ncbi:hypothetical protein, partial [Acetobacter papayae]|uniref:hypothetical protein n=1 Tax=Acetobacter papayae TaxID=1076592 RepID=UPI001F1E7B38
VIQRGTTLDLLKTQTEKKLKEPSIKAPKARNYAPSVSIKGSSIPPDYNPFGNLSRSTESRKPSKIKMERYLWLFLIIASLETYIYRDSN